MGPGANGSKKSQKARIKLRSSRKDNLKYQDWRFQEDPGENSCFWANAKLWRAEKGDNDSD